MGKPDFDVEERRKSPRLEGGASASTDQPVEKEQPDQGRRFDTAAARPKVEVNINTASREELESLPRIGPVLSQRIIDYRQKHGTFKSIDELMNVSGIGDATLQRLKDSITVGDQDKSE
jgi:comEA protein